jgi:hypothetical protein
MKHKFIVMPLLMSGSVQVGILRDIFGKTKDTLKARMNLADMKLRKDLHHKILENGSKKLPMACYTISKQ